MMPTDQISVSVLWYVVQALVLALGTLIFWQVKEMVKKQDAMLVIVNEVKSESIATKYKLEHYDRELKRIESQIMKWRRSQHPTEDN